MFKNRASFFTKEFIFYSLTIYIPVFLFFLAIVFEPTILPSKVSFSFLVLWIITGSVLQIRTFKLQRQMKLLFDSMPFISILVDKKVDMFVIINNLTICLKMAQLILT